MFKIKILDRYIFSQVFAATVVCILLFSIIWIAPEILLRTVQRVLDGTYTPQMGVYRILYEIPKILGNALPVGVFLGTLFTFDKLSKDSEISILRACGGSFYRIIASALVLGVMVAGLSFFVRDRMIPFATTKFDIDSKFEVSTHFVFPVKNDMNKIQKVIIVPKFSNYKIRSVVVLNFSQTEQGKGSSVLDKIHMADFVKFDENNSSWKINNATVYKITPEGVYSKVDKENNLEILSGERGKNAYNLMKYSLKRDRDFTNEELKNYVKLLKQESMDDEYRFMFNKYLERFSQSIISVLFVIFGALLGFAKPRDQRLIGFTAAVLTVFLYYITMPFLNMLAEKGILSPYITAFIAPVILLFVIHSVKKHKDL